MVPALLFDMDGTLVHTDHLHFEAFQTILGPHGIELDWATYRRYVMGKANEDVAAKLVPHLSPERQTRLMEDKEAEYRQLATSLEPAAGLRELLGWATDLGLALAVVTSAPRESADHVLDALGIAKLFRTIVTRDDIADPKPHPLPFLTALKAVGGDPARSVAFEDSAAGVTAATAAGLPVVGLAPPLDENDLKGHGASLIVEDYRDPLLPAFLKRHLGLEEPPAFGTSVSA